MNGQGIKDWMFARANSGPAWPFFLLRRKQIGVQEAWARFGLFEQNQRTLKLVRKHDVLALMGSGPSINELTAADLDFLASVDVLALNFWAHHDLVPNFYMYEGARKRESHAEFFRLVNGRAEAYRDVVFLFKHVPWFMRWGSLAEDWGRLDPRLQRRVRRFSVERLRLRAGGAFDPTPYRGRSPEGPQLQVKGSVDAALAWAYTMGYRKVILYGVDMSSGYFWTHKTAPNTAPHKQSTPGAAIQMPEVLALMREHLFEADGGGLFVASKTSNLFPSIPLWPGAGR